MDLKCDICRRFALEKFLTIVLLNFTLSVFVCLDLFLFVVWIFANILRFKMVDQKTPKKDYSWQIIDEEFIEKYSFSLEKRRQEMLNSLEGISFENYDDSFIEEWLCLTKERDRVFHEIHRKIFKKDFDKNLMVASEALKNALRLSYTLQNEEFSTNLHKIMLACSQELNSYVKTARLEPLQIILTDDVFIPTELPMVNSSNESTDNGNLLLPDVSGKKFRSNVDSVPCDNYLNKIIDWKISPTASEDFDSQSAILETQSNATYESCFDSLMIAPGKKRPFFNSHRLLPLFSNGSSGLQGDMQTPMMDKIKEVLNTSFD